jgi:hypothetical protein
VRGGDNRIGELFSCVDLEARVRRWQGVKRKPATTGAESLAIIAETL